MWRHNRRFWKVLPMPMDAMRCGARPLILSPSR